MVNRIETSADIVLQKKKEDFASIDTIDLFRSEKDPSSKFNKQMTEEQSLSFAPLSTEKDDIAYKKLKGMGDDDIILKKKLAEDFGEKKKSPSPLDRVLEFAHDLFSPRPDKLKDAERASKEELLKKYAALKQPEELDFYDDLYGT